MNDCKRCKYPVDTDLEKAVYKGKKIKTSTGTFIIGSIFHYDCLTEEEQNKLEREEKDA